MWVPLVPPQGMHEVAYTGGLARPLIVPESALGALSAGKLADFVARNYTAPRIALAGAGVAQDELVSLAQPLLEFLPKTGAEPQPKSSYVGGDFRWVLQFNLLVDAHLFCRQIDLADESTSLWLGIALCAQQFEPCLTRWQIS